MKFQHCSMPADDPKKAAETLSRIFGGQLTRFPPGGPDAWMVWSKDESIQLECTPRGTVLTPDDDQVILGARAEPPTRHSEVHIGVCVDMPKEEILEIAKEVGWPAYPSVRIPGEEGFSVIELWVEGKFLLELTDPSDTARLERSVTVEGWKAAFAL
ncbi:MULTISPECIES: hypothetical protein [Sphingobium]|uniref:hypothetical protein n=1 Tax=Sphingobium TaxID=165695 RepID=UPI00159C96CB|nr:MULTISPECIES: hypothetical protein [unclassified Sphingobium]